ncbi:hypothetical protein O6H91_11G022000 [Diphasiastrum complanatum]|uniref:Uncharacterized protein n=1 Tax=Diphasiastrum complanatum TaxID=34168 RepID=A0ACC2C6V8_DIPCM|nr:hypothetical protein O6H91_11G022000 [Diphasiastrum complanatum]
MAQVKMVGVVGAGQMGAGIAQLVAAANLQVLMSDVDSVALARGMRTIASSLARFVKKGTLAQEEADATLARVKTTTSLLEMGNVDVVIEAVSENESLKRSIFAELDRLLKPSSILASNTSSISITRLAASTNRPQRVIGMHFMNPPPLMQLVEIVRGPATADEVFGTIKNLAERLGKTVTCSRDFPGFIVNRILMPMINEAFYALMEGIGSPQDIDVGMKLGWHGRKSGRGVYSYNSSFSCIFLNDPVL